MKNFTLNQFKKYNNLTGWITFGIATLVYLLTIEPTASFWDCGEFIASGNKLEVGHPPGAPLFMLMVRFFTMFAPSPHWVPILANSLSALASSFTILFLFWTITYMARRIIVSNNNEINLTQLILILSAGFVGALAYTFSDTFWFSAVEGEVYATSSLFTALVFWAILKWEEHANEPHANRWLIFIAFLMGLSIGVHLLNLLAIPAIALVYYFKKFKYSPKGLLYTLLISGILLLTIMYGIIQGFVIFASKIELIFVNSLGLPIKSGVLFLFFTTIGLLSYGIYRTHKKGKVILNTILVALTVIMIGYSSYAAIVIRSSANPPMDQNSPDNMFSLLYYLNREQYGDRPLLYGQVFNAQPIARVKGEPTYAPKDGKYVFVRTKDKYKYDPKFEMLFPRMWSNEPNHVRAYKQWSNFKGKPVKQYSPDGKVETTYIPTFGENILFFIRYQLGHMYFRYFMWNFAGRQNDMQGHGEVTKGNWICGIPFIDNFRLGPQDKLPEIYKNNKAHNKYYLLPFILGIVGLAFQLKKHKHDFWVTMMLFIMTGIAIVVYLNQSPYQPRERDYAYAGSFYAFAIWIGLGVPAVYQLIKKIKDHPIFAVATATLCTLGVPVLMASENWDDHDRSGSFIPADFGYNMLIGCKPNSILFTYGDNDTFPLWYNQEVEGVRTDVRVANLSYLSGDWYIDQMKRKAYDSDPIPIRMTRDQYFTGARDAILVIDRIKEPLNLDRVVDFYLSDNPDNKIQSPFNRSERINYIPSKTVFLPIDKASVSQKLGISEHYKNQLVDTMQWSINKNIVLKNGLVLFDLLATNQWERPIYYGTTVNSETFFGLDKYFHLEGMMYRVLPIQAKRQWGTGSVNTEEMWKNLMEKYRFRSINDPKVYLDENKLRIISNYRNLFARLANALIDEGKKDSAKLVLNRCMELIPPETVTLNYFALPLVEAYYRAGDMDNALKYSKIMSSQAIEAAKYMIYDLSPYQKNWLGNELQLNLAILYELTRLANQYEKGDYSNELTNTFNSFISTLEG
ncbi:glycosyltransferase family 117 protein [Tenuifilum thalassicum]|uniref:DUF2723 domain-containing protein n=1 Tax=Tenuifilum thalassicum TaxID=2590900 RepID=A0A7D3XES7_9BACT|nr:DUF2723 domain-containing protein [Tenuifilum thalassicum]QKG78977.1 DUF2723 domain-containing protein [Tenuifilum thalassicum]